MVTNTKNRPIFTKDDNAFKEDYTDELNERSPNVKGIPSYERLETKFLNQTANFGGLSSQKGGGLSDIARGNKGRMASLSFDFRKPESPSSQSYRISYSSRQNNLKMIPEQVPAKIVLSPDVTPNRVNNVNWNVSSQLLDEVSDEIVSKDDKPFNHITNNRALYHQSNIGSIEKIKSPLNGNRKAGDERVEAFPFAIYDDKVHQRPGFKNMTVDLGSLDKYLRSPNKKAV